MNLFTAALPDCILIGGEKYPIKTDFRIWIKFDELFSKREISMEERIISVAELCFDFERGKKLPSSALEMLEGLFSFYLLRSEFKVSEGGRAAERKAPVYSFTEDSHFIYAAFLAQYGIDLSEEELHWWKFCALFQSLESNHKICEIMQYRGIDLSTVKDAEKRKFYRKMKSVYRLKDRRTEKEIEEDIANELSKAF